MQKQIIIGVAIIVLLLLGAGGYFLFSKNSANPTQTQTSATNEAETTTENSAMSSLLDLVTSGKTTQCNFSVQSEAGTTEGTVYISGEKMRGDIETTTENGKTTQMYMIRDGDMYYMWGGELPGGIKMTFDVDELKTNTQANQYVDLNSKTDYSCSDWAADASKFTPPPNVKFTDLSSMMEGVDKTMEEKSGNTDSSACDSITDASAKAACE
ncbi:MAG: hypothetical protein COU25_02385, partial [Candidatus Levybacteria bacterium CG10_big_fil_rev_8_21_14_0_10_35_13]